MIIDKLAWIEIRDRKVLFARTRGQELSYTPGGKREEGEDDLQALTRELQEELGVEIVPESAQHLHTFIGPAHGKPEGAMMQMTCYTAMCKGEPCASSEIEELVWLSSEDGHKTTDMGRTILTWLKTESLID
jgi:8-oxo-dGTP diphosphatase